MYLKTSLRSCKATIKCELCWNSRHTTAMHPDSDQDHNSSAATGFKVDGGEKEISTKFAVDSICTQLCGQTFSGRSCAEVVPLRVYPTGKKEPSIQMNNGFPQKGTIVKYCDINNMSVRAWLNICCY